MTGFFEDSGLEGIVPSHPLDEHTDVEIAFPQDKQTLVYDADSGFWTNEVVPSADLALEDLSNVSATPPTDGQFLSYNDTLDAWEPTNASATLALDDLTDVSATTPAAGEVLTYDDVSGDWISAPPNTGEGTVPDGSATGQVLRWTAGGAWAPTSSLLIDDSSNITIGGTLNGRDIVADGNAQDNHIATQNIHIPGTGFTAMEVVASLPGSPNANTLYFVTG